MLTCSINTGPLLQKLRDLGAATRQPMQQLIKEQARLFVSSTTNRGMVQLTPPFSGKTSQAKARKQGEAKTRRDIRRVYGIPSDVFALIKQRDAKLAKAFWGMVLALDWDRASDLSRRITGHTLQEFDGGAAHRSRRKGTPDGNVSGKRPSLYLRDPVGKAGELEAYIKMRVSHVGIYASGFNAAAEALGAKGIPAWVTRHGTTFSGISIQENASSFYIVISDKVPFGGAETLRRMGYALFYRREALSNAMPYIIRKVCQTAGFAAVAA